MVQHSLDRGYEVVGVCREQSVGKLDRFRDRITIIPGATNDQQVIQHAIDGCDGVLTVLVPWGVNHYSSGTAQAVLDYAQPDARLIFSCGWHITMDGQDKYSPGLLRSVKISSFLGRLTRMLDIDDQVRITSYNVCYTKLLRALKKKKFSRSLRGPASIYPGHPS